MKIIDTDTLKKSMDLRKLASQYTTCQGREGAKERFGPCPECKGQDRFHVTREWFFCRKCHHERGDAIEFIQWVEGLDFHAACERLANGNLPSLPGPLP